MYELYNSILVRPHLDVIQRRYVNGKYHRLTANVSIESSSFPFLYLSLSLSLSLYLSKSMIPKHYTWTIHVAIVIFSVNVRWILRLFVITILSTSL